MHLAGDVVVIAGCHAIVVPNLLCCKAFISVSWFVDKNLVAFLCTPTLNQTNHPAHWFVLFLVVIPTVKFPSWILGFRLRWRKQNEPGDDHCRHFPNFGIRY